MTWRKAPGTLGLVMAAGRMEKPERNGVGGARKVLSSQEPSRRQVGDPGTQDPESLVGGPARGEGVGDTGWVKRGARGIQQEEANEGAGEGAGCPGRTGKAEGCRCRGLQPAPAGRGGRARVGRVWGRGARILCRGVLLAEGSEEGG